MATAKTTAVLSFGVGIREVGINSDLEATFASRGIKLPEGKSITVKRGGISKKLIVTKVTLPDEVGNFLRLNKINLAFFGFTQGEIVVEFDTMTNTMTLRSIGAK